MKYLLVLLLILTACEKKEDAKTETTNGKALPDYIAEYGIPDQNQISPCSGEQDLVRPITKCVRRSTNTQVNVSLCYTLTPVTITLPSPAGTKQIQITGGQRLETCNEGSKDVVGISFICNQGYLLIDQRCQSYETIGSYSIQKDQIYKKQGNRQLLFTIGHDYSVKEQGSYKLIMIME